MAGPSLEEVKPSLTPDPIRDLRGVVTVLNTPFTADDAIDVEGLQKNIALALEAGVAGFLVPAMASEVEKLAESERELLVRETVNLARGRATVIGGASARDSGSRLRLARRCADLGCDGVLAAIPFENEARFERDVRALAETQPGFLMLQDWDAAGYGLPVALIARLAREIPAFQCLKIEVVPAGTKYSEVMEATGGRLHLSGGWAVTQMIEALDRGIHAFMPTGMHAVYTRIHRLYAGGRRKEARDLFNRLLPVLAFSNQHLDISIHFFKRLLHRQGVYTTDRVRKPILAFDAAHQKVADECIDLALALEAECARSS